MDSDRVGCNVWEAVEDFTQRTTEGRVVVEPPPTQGANGKRPKVQKLSDKWYFCKCGRAFLEESLLKEHEAQHPQDYIKDWRYKLPEEDKRLNCMHCCKAFPTPASLRNHLSSHTGEKPWKCEQCQYTFRYHSTLLKHAQLSHVEGGGFKCSECPCQFKYKQVFIRHMEFYHPDVKIDLSHEEKEPANVGLDTSTTAGTSSQSRRKPLVPVVNENGENTYPCHVCGKVFSRPAYLRNHIPVHTGERKSVCDLCGVGFKSSSNLFSHKKVSHVKGGKHRCDKCTCIFASIQGLVRHKRLFHDHTTKLVSRKIALAKLGSSVKAPSSFLRHKPVLMSQKQPKHDQEESKYWCNLCGKQLRSGLEYRNHQQIHSGEKPFVCDTCGFGFRLKSTMLSHEKTSHVPGGIKCQHCSCTFQALVGLRRHEYCYHDVQAHNMTTATDYLEISLNQETDETGPNSSEWETFSKKNLISGIRSSALSQGDRHQCKICKRKFGLSKTLKKHSRVAHIPNGKKCSSCPCSFATVHALRIHFTKYHINSSGIYPAPSSSLQKQAKVTTRDVGLKNLPVKQSSTKVYLCKRCGKSFSSDLAVKCHARFCKSNGKFPCRLCQEMFSHYPNMVRHIKSCHVPNGPYKCQLCTHCYATELGYSRHVSSVHGKSSSTSPTGKNRLSNSGPVLESYASPERKESPAVVEISEKAKCDLCGEYFASRSNFKKHMQLSHVDNGPYPCKRCTCVFGSYQALNAHVGCRHPKLGVISGKTKAPAASYVGGNNLSKGATKAVHTVFKGLSIKPVVPSFRSSSSVISKRPSELMRRIAMVVGGPNSSQNSSDEQTHVYEDISNAVSPSPKAQTQKYTSAQYDQHGVPICDVCGKLYSSIHALRLHASVHTGEKPYSCDLCGLKFRQKGDVGSHKKTNHVKDGKFKCKYCSCRFLSAQGIKRHTSTVHESSETDSPYQHKSFQASSKNPTTDSSAHEMCDDEPDAKKCKVTLAFASETSPVPESNSLNYGEEFSCDLCDASFNHHSNLSRHKKNSHVPWGEFKCSYCSCSFISGTSLRTHEAMFHPDIKRTTPSSNSSLNSAELSKFLLKPVVTKKVATSKASQENSLNKRCSSEKDPYSKTPSASTRESDNIHPIPTQVKGKPMFLCSSCRGQFLSLKGCVKHIETSHIKGGPFPCRSCNCVFAVQRGLISHMAIFHPGQKAIISKHQASDQSNRSYNRSKSTTEPNPMSLYRRNQQMDELYNSNISNVETFEEEEQYLPQAGDDSELDPLDISTDFSLSNDALTSSPKVEASEQYSEYYDDARDPFFEPNLDELRARVPALTVTRIPPEKPAASVPHTVFGNGAIVPKSRVNRFAIYGKK